jgi:hypothetical protein
VVRGRALRATLAGGVLVGAVVVALVVSTVWAVARGDGHRARSRAVADSDLVRLRLPRAGDASPDRERAGDGALANAVGRPSGGDRAILPPPDHFDGPPPASLGGCHVNGDAPPSGGVWALIVGINDYPGDSYDLRSSVNDARDVDQALAGFGVPTDHRLLLLDGAATSCAVRAGEAWLVDHATSDATVVFFYAGHARKLSSTTEAIVTAEGRMLTDATLAQGLVGLQARNTWLALSACYGGGFDELLAPGRVLTAAADANSLAYENENFGRSYLVEYMVRQAMIQGAAPSTVQAAFAYARAAITRDYPNRVPVEYDDTSGAVDLHEPGVAQAPAPSGRPASPATRSPSAPQSPGTPGTPGTTPPPTDGCSKLTLSIIRCG